MSGFCDLQVIPATIASSGSISTEVDLGAKLLVGIAMPAAWDAATLSFQVSLDNGTTWLELCNTAGAVSLTAAAGQFISLDPATYRGVNAIKVRSGTSGSLVTQSADRIVGLAVRSFVP
jgi:hypothetical protein